MADNDRMVFRRASDQKWIDKRNGAERGFVHDTQAAAAASAKQHLLIRAAATWRSRDATARSAARTRSAAPIRCRRATRNIDGAG